MDTKNYKTRLNYRTGGCYKFDCSLWNTSVCDICFHHRYYHKEMDPEILALIQKEIYNGKKKKEKKISP